MHNGHIAISLPPTQIRSQHTENLMLNPTVSQNLDSKVPLFIRRPSIIPEEDENEEEEKESETSSTTLSSIGEVSNNHEPMSP